MAQISKREATVENFVRELFGGTYKNNPAFFKDPGKIVMYWKPYVWNTEEIKVDRGWKVFNAQGETLGIVSPAPKFLVKLTGHLDYIRGRSPKDEITAMKRFARIAYKEGLIK